MVGGAPMMPSFDFFGPPQQQPRPVLQRAPAPAKLAQQPATANPPRPVQPATPPPIVRLQSQDEPTPPSMPLIMPSPEALGLGARQPEGKFDWAKVHGRLDQLGCCCFQIEQQVGGCKLVCLLPTGKTGQTHRIEVL